MSIDLCHDPDDAFDIIEPAHPFRLKSVGIDAARTHVVRDQHDDLERGNTEIVAPPRGARCGAVDAIAEALANKESVEPRQAIAQGVNRFGRD